MGWQLTTLVRRLQGVVWRGVGAPQAGGGRPPAPPAGLSSGPTAPSDAPAGEGAAAVDVAAATAGRLRAMLPVPDRARYDALLAERPDAAPVLARALAATGSVQAVEHLARRWAVLAPAERAAVADPVRVMAHAGRQTDPTTCGSASLTMLAAAGDPLLALWLGTGWLPPVGRPPELAGAGEERLGSLAHAPAELRFAALQRVVKHRTNDRSVLGLPWPARLGTPPWGAAREARYPGVRYVHRMLDDTDRADLAAVLDAVRDAVGRGVPVPLYAGGDTARGWATALPRHVVLAVGATAGALVVWEPSAGRLASLRTADLVAGRAAPAAALGGWNHLMWAVLPVG